MNKPELAPDEIGVISPYALTEQILKKQVNWKKVDSKKLIEDTLGMPYEELFDPKFKSPLYQEVETDTRPETIKKSGSAMSHMITWEDPGVFFNEGTEFFDPVQGAAKDSFLIAALFSVAWARPYIIAQRTRQIGPGQQDFVDIIIFYTPKGQTKVEVSEKLPVIPPFNMLVYARSGEHGEIWPAIYEKAYAKWLFNDSTDKPPIGEIPGGDPVAACTMICGLTPYYFYNSSMNYDEIFRKISSYCMRYKTVNPMVAWTYPTAPSGVSYNSACLAAKNAYSILGISFHNNEKYVILRNTFGQCESIPSGRQMGIMNICDVPHTSQSETPGSPDWWRRNTLETSGVFAMRIDTFKNCFAGFGMVR